MPHCEPDGRCRISFMCQPGGTAVDVVMDNGEIVEREHLQPVDGLDAQFHTYSVPGSYAGRTATIKAWATGWSTVILTYEWKVGNHILSGFVLHPEIPSDKPISGNFLALPGYELGLGQKPGLMAWMDIAYRNKLKEFGGNTLFVQPYALYPPWGFDFRNNMGQYFNILESCKQEGFKLVGFVFNYHHNIDPMWTVDSAKRYIDSIVPTLNNFYDDFCYGLECNDFGFPTRIDDINDPPRDRDWETIYLLAESTVHMGSML